MAETTGNNSKPPRGQLLGLQWTLHAHLIQLVGQLRLRQDDLWLGQERLLLMLQPQQQQRWQEKRPHQESHQGLAAIQEPPLTTPHKTNAHLLGTAILTQNVGPATETILLPSHQLLLQKRHTILLTTQM